MQFGENPKLRQNILPPSSESRTISKEAQNAVCVLLVSSLFYSLAVNVEMIWSSETSVTAATAWNQTNYHFMTPEVGVDCGSFNFG
jgi:hypothetical protein